MPIVRPIISSKTAAICVLFGAWIFHVAGIMSYVLREGRLSMVPIYDDVVYLIDGLNRLAVLDRAGLLACLADLYTHPAHAPLTSLTSVLGLLLSAGSAWGPYLLNGLWVLLVLLLGIVALHQVRLWNKVGILLAALSAPMFASVLAEFRPDPVWGLMVGFAVIVSASTDLARASQKRLFTVGILFGAAVISKPSASPATAVVLASAVATQLGLLLFVQRALSFKACARVLAILTLGAACLILPYLISNGEGIFVYIRDVTGAGSIWKVQTSTWGNLVFYLNRGTGMSMLGWVWYAAVPTFAICLSLLVRAREKPVLSKFASIMVALLTAYLIVTISGNKSLLIGSILYGTIIAAVIWCLGQIVTRINLRGRAGVLLGALVFATFWVPHVATIHRTDGAMVETNKANLAVLPALLEAPNLGGAGTVFVTVPGPAYAGTLEFLARQRGVFRHFVAGYTFDKWEQFVEAVSAADVVVLSEQGMTGQALGFAFPSVRFQARLLETLRGQSEFIGRRVLTDSDQRSVWIFVRSPK